MRPTAVIFDLDGTILDTIDDLADAVNAALASQGMPQRPLDETRRTVGHGIRNLIQGSVPPGTDDALVDAAFAFFKSFYAEHCLDKTVPYDGVETLLQDLKRSGYKLAVVSNKNDSVVQRLIDHWFPGVFDVVLGETAGIRRKPAPDAVELVMRRLGVDASGSTYVGDSEVDVETARNADMACVIVSWGYRDLATLEAAGAETIVDTVEELRETLR